MTPLLVSLTITLPAILTALAGVVVAIKRAMCDAVEHQAPPPSS